MSDFDKRGLLRANWLDGLVQPNGRSGGQPLTFMSFQDRSDEGDLVPAASTALEQVRQLITTHTGDALTARTYGNDEISLSGALPHEQWAAFHAALSELDLPGDVIISAIPYEMEGRDGWVRVYEGGL